MGCFYAALVITTLTFLLLCLNCGFKECGNKNLEDGYGDTLDEVVEENVNDDGYNS